MELDALESTRGRAIMGKTRTCSVRKATTARVIVRAIMPVSDIKNLAGGMLCQRKANIAPTSTKQKAAKSIWCPMKAIKP